MKSSFPREIFQKEIKKKRVLLLRFPLMVIMIPYSVMLLFFFKWSTMLVNYCLLFLLYVVILKYSYVKTYQWISIDWSFYYVDFVFPSLETEYR